MITLHLYKCPRGWYTTTPELSHNAPTDAELVMVASGESEAEAQDQIDRHIGNPPYLEVRKLFESSLKSGLAPSEAVKRVHEDIGVVSAFVWPDHFHEVLGIDRYEVQLLFISWWPDQKTGSDMGDEEFNEKISELENA